MLTSINHEIYIYFYEIYPYMLSNDTLKENNTYEWRD